MNLLGTPFLTATAASAAVAFALARLARRFGAGSGRLGAWMAAWDEGGPRRKLQRSPVPAVGGLAVLVGLAVGALVEPGSWWETASAWRPSAAAAGVALVLAFLAGSLDDRLPGGLAVRWKLLAQVVSGTPLGLSVWMNAAEPTVGIALACAWVLAAVVATNATNTFDNADGAATVVGLVGLVAAGSPAAGALLGFLPANLNARRGRSPRAAPSAYLGDAGSHLVGMLLLVTPGAWPALFVPLADLARVGWLRWRRGGRPWIGDRRHLAHRLQAAGLTRPAVALSLALLALPAPLLAAWTEAPTALGTGFLVSAALLSAAVLATPDPEPVPGLPRRDPGIG